MNVAERRGEIKKILLANETAISAAKLAEMLKVSRQIIVGDIALMRAEGMEIKSTPRGYILTHKTDVYPYIGTIACKHYLDNMLDELYTIVDFGGTCIDVKIDHIIYGEITGQLDISSRYDADVFMSKINEADQPLSRLSDGIHEHRIGCRDKEIFDMIRKELLAKKIIIE